VVDREGIRPDLVKVKDLAPWPTHTSMIPLKSLMGVLKQTLGSTLVLQLPNLQQPFAIATDASHFSVGAVLKQRGHLMAYHPEALEETKMLESSPHRMSEEGDAYGSKQGGIGLTLHPGQGEEAHKERCCALQVASPTQRSSAT